MQIHTVKPHDTIFKIARAYSVSPMKIIENNDLKNPDRLAIGQKLLILTPTRTYNVRGSDTVDRILTRFDMKPGELYRKNPYLAGENNIYPGQILTIRQNSPTLGTAYANGYYYGGTPRERLSMALPYLTYLTVAAGKRADNGIKLLFDVSEPLRAARESTKIPLLRIYDEGVDFPEEYIRAIENAVTEEGFGGVSIAAYRAMRESPKAHAEFMDRLADRMHKRELTVFCEIDANSDTIPHGTSDGYVVNYEKCHMECIPDFEAGEAAAMRRISDMIPAARCYMELAPYAYSGGEEMLISDAVDTAISAGKEILYDGEKKICHFDYNKYLGGKRESVRVAFESLENIKAKLELISELGFMGISFDVARVPVPYLMMFDANFASPAI
ncbi:MAG: LysM peptidoglycan-binding domain-containing protein [Clostridia bacterium]|nr:LysM peptidoglycan-binding domain-containing protein [Clostridia bacterium]